MQNLLCSLKKKKIPSWEGEQAALGKSCGYRTRECDACGRRTPGTAGSRLGDGPPPLSWEDEEGFPYRSDPEPPLPSEREVRGQINWVPVSVTGLNPHLQNCRWRGWWWRSGIVFHLAEAEASLMRTPSNSDFSMSCVFECVIAISWTYGGDGKNVYIFWPWLFFCREN